MTALSEIKGQDRAVSVLKNQFKNSRVPHCYIFCGQRGIGKWTAAAAFAKLLNCKSPKDDADSCGECASCRLIESGNHQDIIKFDLQWQARALGEEDKKKAYYYKIKAVHELVRILGFKLDRENTRVVIIDNAELFTEDASGALLKTLEEPPPKTVFILIAEDIKSILPTIVSRSQVMYFKPFSIEAFGEVAASGSEDDFYAFNASPGLFIENRGKENNMNNEVVFDFAGASKMINWLETDGADREALAEVLDAELRDLRKKRALDENSINRTLLLLLAKNRQESFVNNQLIALDLVNSVRRSLKNPAIG